MLGKPRCWIKKSFHLFLGTNTYTTLQFSPSVYSISTESSSFFSFRFSHFFLPLSFFTFFLLIPFFFFCLEVRIGLTMQNLGMMGEEIMGSKWRHLFHRQAFNSIHSFQTPFFFWPWILASSEMGAFLGFCQVHWLVPFCFISWHISNLPEIC